MTACPSPEMIHRSTVFLRSLRLHICCQKSRCISDDASGIAPRSIRRGGAYQAEHDEHQPDYIPARLAFKTYSAGTPSGDKKLRLAPVYLTHGLMGFKEEFDHLGQEIADQTGHVVYSLDARNHGESGYVDSLDYVSLSEDLVLFMAEQKAEKAILVGHSMGAGTNMLTAIRKPEVVKGLVNIDVGVTESPRKKQLKEFVTMLKMINLDPTRSLEHNHDIVTQILKFYGVEEFLIQRALANLTDAAGLIQWRLNLPVIARDALRLTQLPANFQADKWQPYEGSVHVIAGGSSDFVTQETIQETRKRFPRATFETVGDAGHWVHLDQPEAVCKAVVKFIKDLPE